MERMILSGFARSFLLGYCLQEQVSPDGDVKDLLKYNGLGFSHNLVVVRWV